MATTDKSKRERNIMDAAHRVVALKARLTTTEYQERITSLWTGLGWPSDERPAALTWAGSFERLYEWVSAHVAEIDRIRTALQITPFPREQADAIGYLASGKFDGPLGRMTPLQVARHYGIPLKVVFFYADEESHSAQYVSNRPWLRRYSR